MTSWDDGWDGCPGHDANGQHHDEDDRQDDPNVSGIFVKLQVHHKQSLTSSSDQLPWNTWPRSI
jgi:hypothetical protein